MIAFWGYGFWEHAGCWRLHVDAVDVVGSSSENISSLPQLFAILGCRVFGVPYHGFGRHIGIQTTKGSIAQA